MSKTVIFFPGQASQYVGMGKDLYDESAEVRRLYELASDNMGLDIARVSFEGPVEELKRTEITQPAILLHSLSVLTILKENIGEFDFAAGHSLGEYGALAVTGALDFETAVKAVIRRAKLMEEACVKNPGTMAAVMGLDETKIIEVCELTAGEGVVVPANFNSKIQVVLSGDHRAVEKAAGIAKELGAKRAVLLEVGGAFHSPLMEPAREGLAEYIKEMSINRPNQPVVANVTGESVTDTESIRELLIQQLTSPVRWAQTMNHLKSREVTEVIEIGPGKVLTGLAKRDMAPENSINLDTLEDIRAFEAVHV